MYKVEGERPRGRPKTTRLEVIENDLRTLDKFYAVDCKKCRNY